MIDALDKVIGDKTAGFLLVVFIIYKIAKHIAKPGGL